MTPDFWKLKAEDKGSPKNGFSDASVASCLPHCVPCPPTHKTYDLFGTIHDWVSWGFVSHEYFSVFAMN